MTTKQNSSSQDFLFACVHFLLFCLLFCCYIFCHFLENLGFRMSDYTNPELLKFTIPQMLNCSISRLLNRSITLDKNRHVTKINGGKENNNETYRY